MCDVLASKATTNFFCARHLAAQRLNGGRPSRERRAHAFAQSSRIAQITGAYAGATHLVFVGGADALLGRADAARRRLAQRVDQHVVGQDQVGAIGHAQALLYVVVPAADQLVDFAEQHVRVDDHALRQHAARLRPQDAAG
jgi:hypothetical protein